MALISAHNLTVGTRVKAVTLELQRGDILGLIGPNGAGKTTLLNALSGIIPSEGIVNLDGRNVHSLTSRHRAQQIGLQPQAVNSAWSIRVKDVVALGRLPWGDEDPESIHSAIERAGIQAFSARKVTELSGGERARVWLARVLAGQPLVLLTDEPIANLDIHYQLAVMEVLKQYAQEGHGVIVALHDLSLAARYCNRLCLMDAGEVMAQGTVAEVLEPERLTKTYGIPVTVNLNHAPPIVMPE